MTPSSNELAQWNSRSFDLRQYISISNTMQIIVEIADWDALGDHTVEGGFDKFEITSQATSSLIEPITNGNRKLVKVVDLVGRETNRNSNSVIFYIYDDGSVDKRFILK